MNGIKLNWIMCFIVKIKTSRTKQLTKMSMKIFNSECNFHLTQVINVQIILFVLYFTVLSVL
jgi:hypothetical protein